MGAERTGLKKYQGASSVVYAARISEILLFVPFPGAKTLRFDDSPKKVNLIPEWLASNNPVIGGYFVVEDMQGNTICRFVDATAFSAEFAPA